MFQVGDVVECIDTEESGPFTEDCDCLAKVGGIYKVSKVTTVPTWDGNDAEEGILLEGEPDDGESAYPASFFRKIQPASKEFINSIRIKQDA